MIAQRSRAGWLAAICVAMLVPQQSGGAQLATSTKPVRTIGAANGSVEEAFGFIGDVEISRAASILVLDRTATHIAWFGSDGRFVRRIGREGRGPGEFQVPHAMTIDAADRLHVYDSRNRRITVYALSGQSASHVADQRMERRVYDICAAGTRRFVLTPHDSMVVQELDGSGSVLRSFGPREEPEPEVVRKVPGHLETLRGYYNAALMSCDVESGTIALAHENVPIVRLFSLETGARIWRTELGDFHGRILGVSERGGFSFRPDPKRGVSHYASTVVFARGRLVVTLWEGGASNPEGRLEARFLELDSGREVYRSVPQARLAKVVGSRSYAFVQHPHPAVFVY
jgi:hypothetical protein